MQGTNSKKRLLGSRKEINLRKLLIIGADYPEIDIVNAAREMGYYSIVTDNRLNWDDAPAKKLLTRHGISAMLILIN